MGDWAAVVVAAIGGGMAGWWLRDQLRAGRHLRAGETASGRRWNWLPYVCGAAVALVTLRLVRWEAYAVWPAYLLVTLLGVALAAIDLDRHRLPDRLLLPGTLALVTLLAIGAAFSGQWHRWAVALVCGAVAGLVYLGLALAVPGGLGLGDVKLAVLLGSGLGWFGPLVAVSGLALGFVIGGLIALVLVAARRARASTHLAFGPAMLLGALGGLLLA